MCWFSYSVLWFGRDIPSIMGSSGHVILIEDGKRVAVAGVHDPGAHSFIGGARGAITEARYGIDVHPVSATAGAITPIGVPGMHSVAATAATNTGVSDRGKHSVAATAAGAPTILRGNGINACAAVAGTATVLGGVGNNAIAAAAAGAEAIEGGVA